MDAKDFSSFWYIQNGARMSNTIDKLCWKIVEMFPNRSRVVRNYGEDYLLRFYIKHNGLLPGLYLHKFFQGDQDRELHNHPWMWSFSFILTGGYLEERKSNTGDVYTRHLKPGHLNLLGGKTFHRISLVDKGKGAWTIFCSGKKVKDWGFLIAETGEVIPHKEYLENR